jgi:hypothetical protein
MNKKRIAAAAAASFLLLLSLRPLHASASIEVIRVSLDVLQGFSGTDRDRAKTAADTLERVLNSEEFHQRVTDFTYDGKKQFADNDGKTNEEVYATLMGGRENYTQTEDHVANLDLNLYTPPWYKKRNTVGYGYDGHPEIYINSYHFREDALSDVIENMGHEWTHKLGFTHDFQRTAKRPFSVPYGVGGIIHELAARAR